MERLTQRTKDGIVGNNNGVENFPLYSLYDETHLDHGLIEQCFNKLAEYEDLEEQGLLLRLPCKVGDTVYVICECETIPPQLDGTLYGANGEPGTATGYYCPYEENCPHECFKSEDYFSCDYFKNKEAVFEDEVAAMWCDEFGVNIITSNCPVNSRLGEYVFLTKEEAEQALARMEGEHE